MAISFIDTIRIRNDELIADPLIQLSNLGPHTNYGVKLSQDSKSILLPTLIFGSMQLLKFPISSSQDFFSIMTNPCISRLKNENGDPRTKKNGLKCDLGRFS